MKRSKKNIILTILLFVNFAALSQTSQINWSSFNNGFGIPGNSQTQLKSVIGQSISGSSGNGNSFVTSGFLVNGGNPGPPANTGTFVVTTTADTGIGSFRRALDSANTKEGLNIIAFNIPGSGVHTITPLTPLPQITDATIIDGYTQPGSNPNSNGPGQSNNAVILIEINGTNSQPGNYGACININSSNVTIKGLVINRSPNAAIGIHFYNQQPSGIVIEGNFIGTNSTGTQALANNYGVQIEVCKGVTIGGTSPESQNLISGNTINGIGIGTLSAGGSNHIIQGNLIGTDASGTNAIPNGTGIRLAYQTRNVLVGGTSPQTRNVISGNTQRGISCDGGTPAYPSQTIKGNFIGTDVSGTSAIGNGSYGINTIQYSTKIGGSEPGAGNLISGNGDVGIYIQGGDSSIVLGNFIGTDTSGTVAIGNVKSGINIQANNVIVGGSEPGEANIIAFNGTQGQHDAGILVSYQFKKNAILSNSIFSNAGPGIDLSNLSVGDGVTQNDQCDTDVGSNDLQNFPVLTSVILQGSNTIIEGSLNSVANKNYRIEFFSNEEIDPTQYGEGKFYLGYTNVTTDGNCNVDFSVSLPVIVFPNYYVTATATDENNNTSEFSASVPVIISGIENVEIPTEYQLLQNFPNPFNPSTIISYQLPARGNVTLKVYDVLGNEVATLVDEYREEGKYEVEFDGRNLASGLFFYKLQAGSFVETKKMVLIK